MRNLRYLIPALLVLGGLSILLTIPVRSAEAAKTRLGLNLSSVVYYAPEIAFKDLVKQGSKWLSHRPGQPWGQGGQLALDADGWITRLEADQWAELLLFPDLEGRYPGGDYICEWQGAGEIVFAGSAKGTPTNDGKIAVKIVPSKDPVALQIRAVNPANPLRNISLIPAQYSEAERKNPFDPLFVEHLKGYSTLRFMDWQQTNNSPVLEWADRAKPKGFQGGPLGVALEYQIELANKIKAEPWFCIPHKASDDYVRLFARFVSDKLDPSLKFNVEYSNETWNGQFQQAKYCQEMGQKQNLSKNAYEAQLRYSSRRSVEIFKIIERELGSRSRFVRILGAQAVNPWSVTTVLDWEKASENADALAVAPYFGNRLGSPKLAPDIVAGGLDRVFAECRSDIDLNKQTLRKIAAEATSRKLELMAYEGGQHLVGTQGEENNEALTKLFHAANRDPRMGELYAQDLANWREIGGGLNCVFASMGRYSKWGSWGLLEYHRQDEKTAPKYQAVREFMRTLK